MSSDSVKAFSAAVTAKVRLKIRFDSAFIVARSVTLRSSSANLPCNAEIRRGISEGATRSPIRVSGVSGKRRVSAA